MDSSSECSSDTKEDLPTTSLLLQSREYSSLEPPERWAPRPRVSPWFIAAIASILFTNTLVFTAGWIVGSTRKVCHSVAEPPIGIPRVLQDISTRIRPKLLNSTLQGSEDNMFRKHSSRDADEAWAQISAVGNEIIFVSKEDARQSDIDPNRHAYWDNKEMGLVGYPVGIEVHHQLHCLNVIRKNLYYYVGSTNANTRSTNAEKFHILHVDHCVDYLRNRLMCTADIGLMPAVWLGNDGDTASDMARIHSCRNFDAVLQFSKQHGVALPKVGIVKPKPGDYIIDDYI